MLSEKGARMVETYTQFLSQAEWYAGLYALLAGWFITEAIKRLVRNTWRWVTRPGVFPLVGFCITFAAAVYLWPRTGMFPHPYLAAALIAATAPAIYKAVIFFLRRAGLGGLANIITGERRAK